MNATICHFGTAELSGEISSEAMPDDKRRLERPGSSSMKFEGCRGYMAPEFQTTGNGTKETDVYSFGVVLLELLSGDEMLRFVVDEGSPAGYRRVSLIFTAKKAMEEQKSGLRKWIDRRLKDSYPVDVAEKTVKIGLECLEEDPGNRTDMSSVAARISKLYMMAARQASRIVLSLLFNQQTRSSLSNESSGQFLPSTTTIFTRNEFCRRRIQTQAQVTNPENTLDKSQGVKDSVSVSGLDDVASQLGNSEVASVGGTVVSNLKPSPRHAMAAMFTCKVCDTRSLKTFARESYEKGIVVARCGGCNNLHMLADRLGWFGEPSSVEELLAAHGEEVRKGSADTLSLTLEDLAGSAVRS